MSARIRLPHTPFLDAWRAHLTAATAERRQKAELARILAGRSIPNGEDVLEISHWLQPRTAPHPPRRRTDGTDYPGPAPHKRNY
jgi:hypothetical protein